MKNTILATIIAFSTVATTPFGTAMPGPKHNEGTTAILEAPARRGGAQGVDQAKAKAVHDWMDNPSKRLGPNHNRIRHNPIKAARALSGNGKIDPAKLNIARMHKVQDVAHNVKPVDGWKITARMRKQAAKILKHVEKHGSLPKKLPVWVDDSGPLLDDIIQHADAAGMALKRSARQADDAALSVGRTAKVLSTADEASKAVKALSRAGKVAGPLGVAVEAGVRGGVSFKTEKAYRDGKINRKERNAKHTENGAAMAGGMAGAMGGAKAGAFIGTGIGACFGGVGAPVGAGIGGVAGAIAGGIGGDWLGGKAGEAAAERLTEEK